VSAKRNLVIIGNGMSGARSAEEIVILKEADGKTQHMVGDTVQCWFCKHEFIVTSNCWKWRELKK